MQNTMSGAISPSFSPLEKAFQQGMTSMYRGWTEEVVPFLHKAGQAFCDSSAATLKELSSSVTTVLNSVDQSSLLFRLVSNVSSLAKALFGKEEGEQVDKLRNTTEVIRVTRCFTFPQYILSGQLARDWQNKNVETIGAIFFWALADIAATGLFLFPTLSTWRFSVIQSRSFSIGEAAIVADTMASCCDLAGRVHKAVINRKMTLAELFDILSTGSDTVSALLPIVRLETKVLLVALYAFSNLTSLLSHVITQKKVGSL